MAFMIPVYTNESFSRVTADNGESYLCPEGTADLTDSDEIETVDG